MRYGIIPQVIASLLLFHAKEAVSLLEQDTESERQTMLRSPSSIVLTTNTGGDRSTSSRPERLQWPFFRTHKGLSMSRTITKIPPTSYLKAKVQGAFCDSKDEYGSNKCKFDWGDTVKGTLVLEQGVDITDEHVIEGTFTVDRLVHWNFSCAACGKPCTITVPVMKKQYTLNAPSCPLRLTHKNNNEKGDAVSTRVSIPFNYTFPDSSPADGVKIHFVGKLKLTSQKDSSKILAAADIDFIMK